MKVSEKLKANKLYSGSMVKFAEKHDFLSIKAIQQTIDALSKCDE